MKYDKKYPYYNHLKDNSELISKLMQTKSDIWNYEQEVRSMKFMQGAHAFKKEALVEIAFGLNCKNNDVSLIKKIVSDNEYLVVQFSQAHKLKKEFGLKIVRC